MEKSWNFVATILWQPCDIILLCGRRWLRIRWYEVELEGARY